MVVGVVSMLSISTTGFSGTPTDDESVTEHNY